MEIVNKGKSQGWKSILKIIIPYLVIDAVFHIVGGLIMGLDLRHMQMAGQTTAQLFVTCFMGMVGTVAVVWLFTTKVDKKSFISIGFDKTNMVKDIALGLAIGFMIMLSGFSILVLTHQLQFVDIKFNALNLVYSVGIFVFVAVSEEVFTRGYILRNLAISFNK